MASGSVRAAVATAGRAVGGFSDRYPWLGPLVFMLASLYFVAQIAVAWVWNPPYSIVDNTISDLGNTACGRYDGVYVCSPRHVLMNVTIVLLGVVMAAGSLLIYHEFSEKTRLERLAAVIGFTLMAIGGVGAALVGIFPENTLHAMHVTGAGIAIIAGNVAIFVLGLALLDLPEGLRRFMLVFSALSLIALICFGSHKYFGIGAGTMERIAAYPETLWLIVFGLWISRTHPGDLPPARTTARVP
jgi:hypothetical membrane protein